MIRVVSWDEAEGLPVAPAAAPDLERDALTRPDTRLAAVASGAVTGTVALWWREPVRVPERPAARAGRIGHARWTDAEAGAALLGAALDRLRAEGCALALGPLDGSTWHAYRVVTDPAPTDPPEPPFALEPWPEPAVAEAFERAGFVPVARYLSSRVDALPDESARHARDLAALAEAGIGLRPLAGETDLEALHPLLLRAFAGNPYYAPLGLREFLALYRPLLARVDPRLVLVAERDRQPVGVVLALPDLAQAARGEPVDTVLVKTLAVDPETRGAGLGGALVRAVQERARQIGYRRAIHALMHDANASTRISAHLGRPIRRYALLGREL